MKDPPSHFTGPRRMSPSALEASAARRSPKAEGHAHPPVHGMVAHSRARLDSDHAWRPRCNRTRPYGVTRGLRCRQRRRSGRCHSVSRSDDRVLAGARRCVRRDVAASASRMARRGRAGRDHVATSVDVLPAGLLTSARERSGGQQPRLISCSIDVITSCSSPTRRSCALCDARALADDRRPRERRRYLRNGLRAWLC